MVGERRLTLKIANLLSFKEAAKGGAASGRTAKG